MKVTIVIPVYNVEQYIEKCIRSVMQQTYKGEAECLLIDDCGSDRSMEIAEELIIALANKCSDEDKKSILMNVRVPRWWLQIHDHFRDRLRNWKKRHGYA